MICKHILLIHLNDQKIYFLQFNLAEVNKVKWFQVLLALTIQSNIKYLFTHG